MINIAKQSKKNRDDLFINTASKIGINVAIIEKDFWVCVILDYLFNRCYIKNKIAFKGGTSLSKCFDLIQRFSEDIDLILDWEVLGYSNAELWAKRSNKQQDIFNKKVNGETHKYLKDVLLPIIKKDLKIQISSDIDCYMDDTDALTIIIQYPHSFSDSSIIPSIRLEIGTLAAWTPCSIQKITPICAQYYSSLFKNKSTVILSVSPDRTFWEKITILHREANRPNSSKLPDRYSRHYYDVYCMSKSIVKKSAFKQIDLLKKVVEFKNKFYRCQWAKYQDAKIGTIKLLPNKHFIKSLENDYKHMSNMIYGNKPTFSELIKEIKKLEIEINSLK